jgi:hypothetical protein
LYGLAARAPEWLAEHREHAGAVVDNPPLASLPGLSKETSPPRFRDGRTRANLAACDALHAEKENALPVRPQQVDSVARSPIAITPLRDGRNRRSRSTRISRSSVPIAMDRRCVILGRVPPKKSRIAL